MAEVQESLVDPPGHRRSGGLDRTRDARDSILLLILFRSFSYGDGGRSTEHDRICRCADVAWASVEGPSWPPASLRTQPPGPPTGAAATAPPNARRDDG